jgi:hypothetical protein
MCSRGSLLSVPRPRFELGILIHDAGCGLLLPIELELPSRATRHTGSGATIYRVCNRFPLSLSGFSTAGSKFLSIVRRARMVSAGDNGIYTNSDLRGVIPYIQCVAAVFLSQVCS